MICPKCSATMKTYDRLGIHVEQCEKCRGIFLDHGELDQILAAEQTPDAPPPLPGYPPAGARPPADPGYAAPAPPPRGYGDSPRPWGGRGYSDSPRPYGYGGKRKKSILEQLFD
jgi:uncharacterized protein